MTFACRSLRGGVAVGALVVCAGSSGAAAQSAVGPFYAGRTIELVVGSSAGAAYDSNARVVARHIGRHIPGTPTIIVRNMPGAGGLVSANHIYSAAARDGSVLGIFNRGIAMYPLLDTTARLEPRKLNWIGSSTKETSLVAAMATTPFRTIEDARRTEMLVGGTGTGADTVVLPLILNATIGTRLKPVLGYPGNAEALLAMEKGEVHGTSGLSLGTLRSAKPEWLTGGKVNFLLQLALSAHPTLLKGVPVAPDLATDPIARQALELVLSRQTKAYPITAPPGVPVERVAALRAAFMATMRDPAFAADLEKAGFELSPVDGEEIAALLERIYAAPPAAIELARNAVAAPAKK